MQRALAISDFMPADVIRRNMTAPLPEPPFMNALLDRSAPTIYEVMGASRNMANRSWVSGERSTPIQRPIQDDQWRGSQRPSLSNSGTW